MDQADSGWRTNRVLGFESFRLGRRRGGRDDADTRKRTVPLSLTGRRAGARRTSGHRKGRTDSRHGRRIGIGLSSSSPPNFNWELTRFSVRCNSRRDATRRPLPTRREGERTARYDRYVERRNSWRSRSPAENYLPIRRPLPFAIALPTLSSLFLGEQEAFRSFEVGDTEIRR